MLWCIMYVCVKKNTVWKLITFRCNKKQQIQCCSQLGFEITIISYFFDAVDQCTYSLTLSKGLFMFVRYILVWAAKQAWIISLYCNKRQKSTAGVHWGVRKSTFLLLCCWYERVSARNNWLLVNGENNNNLWWCMMCVCVTEQGRKFEFWYIKIKEYSDLQIKKMVSKLKSNFSHHGVGYDAFNHRDKFISHQAKEKKKKIFCKPKYK